MRIKCLIIFAAVFSFSTVACSQPEPVQAEYQPSSCDCVESPASVARSGSTTTGSATTGSATSSGLAAPTTPASTLAAGEPGGPAEISATPAVGDQAQHQANAPADDHPAAADTAAPTSAKIAQSPDSDSSKPGAAAGPINLNEASADQLETLPGIGPALAGRIIAFRQKRRFEKPAHLLRVKGIGQAKLAKLVDKVTVD